MHFVFRFEPRDRGLYGRLSERLTAEVLLDGHGTPAMMESQVSNVSAMEERITPELLVRVVGGSADQSPFLGRMCLWKGASIGNSSHRWRWEGAVSQPQDDQQVQIWSLREKPVRPERNSWGKSSWETLCTDEETMSEVSRTKTRWRVRS